MAVITVPGMFLTGNHAGRPAATAVGKGSLYACSTHNLIYQSDGASWTTWATLSGVGGSTAGVSLLIDGGGTEIADGIAGHVEVPFACTITAVRLLADQAGSIVVDIWKDTYANYPPVNADSITSAAVPTISGATKAQDTTLTGWTTSVSAGDILYFNVDSCTTIERCLVSLTVTRV